MKKSIRIFLSCTLAGCLLAGAGFLAPFRGAEAAVYRENEYMKNLSLPEEDDYVEKDWKQTTMDFLEYVFDESNHYTTDDGVEMKIARYSAPSNAKNYFASIGREEEAPEDIWTLPTYLGMGNDATVGEGLTALGAIMSGALVGMDLTDYVCSDGTHRNFVKSAVEYYSYNNGEKVVLNNIGSHTGNTFWYELLPGVLFAVLGTQYPSESYYMYDIITETARQWQKAVVGLGGANADFWHTAYKFETGQPFDGNWYEPDAAAGMAYILYAAYSLNANMKANGEDPYASDEEIDSFLQAAIWSMNYLERLDRSPFYEVLTFLAPYLAARMNAEQGTNYDVAKMMSWLMDGSSAVRKGWGLVTENWGDKYTNGLMGSLTDGDGYAFAMNTFDAMLGFAPMVKYDTRFARDISRWVLCVSQSARNYYPSEYSLDGERGDAGAGHTDFWYGYEQSGNYFKPEDKESGFIAYEGLRRYRRYVVWEDGKRSTAWDRTRTPYASGDAFTFDWGGLTDYGFYGSAHVGLFGSTISYTDVPMILRTDLSKLDVYSKGTIPFSMYYNPYQVAKQVSVTLSASGNRLYDTVEKQFVPVTDGKITIAPDTTLVLAEIPAGADVVKNGVDYTCNGEFVAQERGYVELSLYRDASGTDKIEAGSTVEGTIYASLSMEAPEGAKVESLVLEHGGNRIYSGTAAPQAILPIDTKTLKNGSGVMTATLTLEGGKIEKSSVLLQVLNVVKTPALGYDSVSEMADVWNEETQNWQAQHADSDHTSVASVNQKGEFTVTVASPKGYGFVTSELFSLDFSRGPVLEFTVSEASAKFAVKVYVDGMEIHNNFTGAYVLRDTDEAKSYTINILDAIREEDRTFDMSGAHKASVKISPVGEVGSTVSFSEFNVYHMYTSPVLDEPEQYEWGHNFTSEWLSLWSGSESEGGVNGASLKYTTEGSVIVKAADASAEYAGVASPVIVTDLSMNPVFDLTVKDLKGAYFAAVRFDGNSKLYVIADDKTDRGGTLRIMEALKARYPEEASNFVGSVRMRIVVGVKGSGEVEISQIKTYYQLPAWGTTVRTEDDWLEWEAAEGTTASSTRVFDATRNRYVITNNAPVASQTATAGARGKFSVNLDYNPEATVRVRNGTGTYRFSVVSFEGGASHAITGWISDRGEVKVNLRTGLSGVMSGLQNIWFMVEVRGGGNFVEIDRMTTFYTAIEPDFETGETLGAEIASWAKDETNPSNVGVVNGNVVLTENYIDSRGLYTSEISVAASANPHIVVDIVSLSEGAVWYLNAIVGGVPYALTGEGCERVGTTDIDVVAALKEAGYAAEGEITAVYEIGGRGVSFSVEIATVRFARRLDSPSGLVHDEAKNVVSWNAVPGAQGYSVRVENASGEKVAEESEYAECSYALGGLNLSDGVYRIYVGAYGEHRLSSAESRLAFKQGDIPSVTLGKAEGFTLSGMKIVWNEVQNAEYYDVELFDADGNVSLLHESAQEPQLDLSAHGLSAFNYRLTVQTKGDGVVYLDGERTEYAFYTNVVENYNASKFASMSASANQAYAEYDAATDTAAVRIPYTNWGGVTSLAAQLNFDRSPVLAIRFAPGCEGGYYLQILIDGVSYYLADNTFTIHGNTEPVDAYFDVLGILSSRTDGPSALPTGVHSVAVVFGATSDGFQGVQTPVVRIAYARLIEMTPGSGTAKLGTLSAPVVVMDGRVAKWQAVEHADAYTVVIGNELGVLLTETVTETEYDCSLFARAGEYVVQVTATAANYFSSDTGSATFTIGEDEPTPSETPQTGCGSSFAAGGAVVAAGILLAAVAVVLAVRKKQD